jgi:hypothetical protein
VEATSERAPITANARIASPEGTAPPPGGFASWDDYMAAVEQQVDRDAILEGRRVGKAMRLATSLAVFDALLGRQPVPVGVLDPDWRGRYGL